MNQKKSTEKETRRPHLKSQTARGKPPVRSRGGKGGPRTHTPQHANTNSSERKDAENPSKPCTSTRFGPKNVHSKRGGSRTAKNSTADLLYPGIFDLLRGDVPPKKQMTFVDPAIIEEVVAAPMDSGLVSSLEEQSEPKTLSYTISELMAIRDTMIEMGYNSYSMVDASQMNFVRYLIYNTPKEEEEEEIEWDMPDANDIGDMDLSKPLERSDRENELHSIVHKFRCGEEVHIPEELKVDVMNELFNDLQRVQHEETITPTEEEVGWTDHPVVVMSPQEKSQVTEEFVDPAIISLQEMKEQEPCAHRSELVSEPAEEKQEDAFVEWMETPISPQAINTLPSFDLPSIPETQGWFNQPLFPDTAGGLIPPRPFSHVHYGLQEGSGVGLSLFEQTNQFDLFSANAPMRDMRKDEPSILQMVREDKDRAEKEKIRKYAEEKERRRVEAAIKAEEAKKKQGPLPVMTVKKPSMGMKPRSLMLRKGN